MEGVVHVHVRHDLIAGLDQIVGAALGGNLGESKIAFGIDQPGIHGHSAHIDHFRIFRNLHRAGRTDGGDLAPGHHQYAVVNRAVRNREQFSALKHKQFSAAPRQVPREANRESQEQLANHQRPTANDRT